MVFYGLNSSILFQTLCDFAGNSNALSPLLHYRVLVVMMVLLELPVPQ